VTAVPFSGGNGIGYGGSIGFVTATGPQRATSQLMDFIKVEMNSF